jgi:hypothetical protein
VIVTTASGSRYELADRKVRRLRGPGAGPLRRDKDWLPVIAMTEPTIGEAWILVLDLRGDGIATLRTTNTVTAIEH